MPFHVAAHDGVLTLTLDTPGSPVNIFNHATAHQLLDILSTVTPATTRAIVFDTAKAHSFINGVGLLLAHASQTYDDIVRASTPPWTAYRAVRDAAVPTIAIVQGNCFGCGVEFVLSCDYRIACDTCETQFYMTELNDYLFIPVFGSTRTLPEAVGLAGAVDLLLWGERWGSARARDCGLVDEVFPCDGRAEPQRRFVEHIAAQGVEAKRRRTQSVWSAHDADVMAAARGRVAALPSMYQPVYGDALGLLEAGMRQTHSYDEQQRRELRCSAASALSPLGKSAYAFFYVRQMASQHAAGRARGDAPAVRLCAAAGLDHDASTFVDDLRARTLPGVRFGDAAAADFRLVGARGATPAVAAWAHADTSAGRPADVRVRIALAAAPDADTEIYAPAYPGGGRLLELAVRAGGESHLGGDATARLARTLQRFGFEVARTTPAGPFLTTRLLLAYLLPLVRRSGPVGDGGVINATLRNAGFVRRPHDILERLDRGWLAAQLAPLLGRTAAEVEASLEVLRDDCCTNDAGTDEPLIDALCLSLLEVVLSARAAREVRDPSIIDLIARELLDIPRHLCSLCSWLKKARVADAIRAADVQSLVTESAFETARAFVADGRELYR